MPLEKVTTPPEKAISRLSSELLERFYYQMVLVRKFEERIFELFKQGELFGTTHAYIGQEASAVAVLNNLESQDIVFSNHRCHGHFLVRTGDVKGLLAELMGRVGGACRGRGGSQHLCKGNFYTNGVQGSIVPVAAGMAFAEKVKGTEAIVVVFIGDGTFGQGVVYESFNMMSLWGLPLLVVVENNRYAQTTPISLNFAGSFIERARAFGLSSDEVETNDVVQLNELFGGIISNVRSSQKAHVQVIHTYRLCPHSKGDDYRPPEEIESWREKDPLIISGRHLDDDKRIELEERARDEIERAEQAARAMAFPDLAEGKGF
jgi:TPP-dependent pyruvate/acetoin dehydrogenase alpha subunit